MTHGQDRSEPAPAKVNLFLHVTGKRADGYHLLDSLAIFAGLADVVAYAPAEGLSLNVEGPFADSLAAEPDNLVLRAARALADSAGVRAEARLTLTKRIPVASGIGGGSADAAAALRLLCRAWRIAPDAVELDRIAARLGADVPVCLRDRPMRMGGIGEQLTAAPVLPSCGLLLVNPGIPLSTVSVFRARTGGFTPDAELPKEWIGTEDMAADVARLTNDLESPAISLVPAIGDVLAAISGTPGCLLARMSGSGATCFGLYAREADAKAAADALRRRGWWRWSGELFS